MSVGLVRTDVEPLLPLIPVLRGDERCKWVACDDSDDGLPGLVTTWVHILVTVDDAFAEELAGYADLSVGLPSTIPASLGVDRSLTWKTGHRLAGGLGIAVPRTTTAISGKLVYACRRIGG